MYIELVKGKLRWFYHLKAKNGNTLVTSQKYYSHSNAKRAANAAATKLKVEVK